MIERDMMPSRASVLTSAGGFGAASDMPLPPRASGAAYVDQHAAVACVRQMRENMPIPMHASMPMDALEKNIAFLREKHAAESS